MELTKEQKDQLSVYIQTKLPYCNKAEVERIIERYPYIMIKSRLKRTLAQKEGWAYFKKTFHGYTNLSTAAPTTEILVKEGTLNAAREKIKAFKEKLREQNSS